jgi:hypothetical protein
MARQNRKGGEDSELVKAIRKGVRKSVQVTEVMPLNLPNEGKSFVVSIAVSRARLIEFLRKDTVSQGVLGVRRIEDRDLDALEASQDEESEDSLEND